MKQKGVRFIGGREYLLCGRYNFKHEAEEAKENMKDRYIDIKIVKMNRYFDYGIYVHGIK